jgi:fatty acid amide hydrolase
MNDEVRELSAIELAGRIARGEVSALEVVEAFIARVEEVNLRLNALVVKRYEEARREARAVDERRRAGERLGALAGVPVTLKECLDLAGTPSTFGLETRREALATADAVHVARLREAGAIVIGKSNVAQLLLFIESDNPVYGRTNHPEDAERSPGGSSGGEGALLAAGASALGLGTDIGGSVRVPAAFCGVYGMKPTSGRCDDAGRFSVPIGQRAVPSQVGVLGRSARDVALGLEIINGGRTPPPDGTLVPPMPLGDPAAIDVTRLRIAWYEDDGTFSPSPAVRRAVRESAALLRARGATLVEWTPPEVSRARDLFYGLLSADGLAGCRRMLGRGRRDPRIADLVLAASKPRLARALLAMTGRGRTAREIVANYGPAETDRSWRLVEEAMDYRARFAEAATGFDAILSPATALPTFRHGASAELALGGAYTCLWNLLGWPAGVAPVTRVRAGEESLRPASKDKMDRAARDTERGSVGLPIGVQIAAPPWREDVALAVMDALGPAFVLDQAPRTV